MLDILPHLFYRTNTSMNVRLITVLIFVLIIAGGLGFFFMNERNTQDLAQRISPTGAEIDEETPSETEFITVWSNDNRVSFQYPSDWTLAETTDSVTRGKFGNIFQSWVIQNSPEISATPASLPDNTARIEIMIQTGGSNLSIDDLVDCSMKSVTCDKIGIDNEQFITSDTVLNTGRETMTVATFYDDKILTAQAIITPGNDMATLKTQTTALLHSFTFSDNTTTND